MRDLELPVRGRGLLLAFIVSLGLMARLLCFQAPLLDHHAWRQADTAMIARNFVRAGLHPLAPQTDARGSSPSGVVATGLELHAIVTAAIARLTGFSDPLARVVSALTFPVSALFLWSFLLRRDGALAALCGVWVYALGLPLVLFAEHAVWNEPFLIMLTFASLWCWQRGDGRPLMTALAIVSVSVLAGVKPQWLIVLAPMIALSMEREGWAAWRRPSVWLLVIAGAGSAAAWLWHMDAVGRATGLTFGAADKLFNPDDMSVRYAFIIGRRLVRDLLGPIGLVAFAIGLVAAVKQGRRVELAWTAAFLAYLVIVSRGNRVHDYYQLPLAPLAAIVIPGGILWIVDALRARVDALTAVGVLLWLMLLTTFVRSVSFHSWYEVDARKASFCRALGGAIPADERVTFVAYNSPDVLYCLDRKGWLLAADFGRVSDVLASAPGTTVIAMPDTARLADARPAVARVEGWVAVRP
jgi:hypothetical protein